MDESANIEKENTREMSTELSNFEKDIKSRLAMKMKVVFNKKP